MRWLTNMGFTGACPDEPCRLWNETTEQARERQEAFLAGKSLAGQWPQSATLSSNLKEWACAGFTLQMRSLRERGQPEPAP